LAIASLRLHTSAKQIPSTHLLTHRKSDQNIGTAQIKMRRRYPTSRSLDCSYLASPERISYGSIT